MKNNKIKNQLIKDQYKDDKNLNSRLNLHSYNINKIDWNDWCFNQMDFPNKARILELGCGPGGLWERNKYKLNKDWNITLSDFSKGMLECAKNTLEQVDYDFKYKEIDIQDIPYEDGSFDVVIARHMLYHVPDIEKALSEIKRVLATGGTFYATTNGRGAMAELYELIEKFDPEIGLNNLGMGERFEFENGKLLLEKCFSEVKMQVFEGKIVVPLAEPIVSYVASTMRGSAILVGQKKQEFTKYVEDYIKEKGSMAITTKSCIFKVKK
ncbi:class I SAM-dependent methyltransferase [Clostridium estertheticum]|uniref:class I SAM-dependent methyltransferase n=1 Tax=Clostridium estertheticum TaxID=238834 RepID=UPI0013E95FFC|nr:class I SAM-dependent methyltransferase [Clostridium estertheticum]MBZ9686319.1 class I SAM-dependent methyltransferase [Clostridium estertheticum]